MTEPKWSDVFLASGPKYDFGQLTISSEPSTVTVGEIDVTSLLAFVQAWSDGLSLSDEQTAEILEAMAAGLRSG